jgi:hypothetical protein
MKQLIKRTLARLLQSLFQQPFLRTTGQRIINRLPRIKSLLLRLLYNIHSHPKPETIEHHGLIEERLNRALAQRIKGLFS